MPTIIDIIDEPKRLCGVRKEGAIYMRADGPGAGCGKLPVILDICPACGQGVKFCRSWTWVVASKLIPSGCCGAGCMDDECCLFIPPERAGLVWVGASFYPTPADWLNEAHDLGVSRRIQTLPHGFKIGEHWVMTAHKKVREMVCHSCGDLTDPDSHEKSCPDCKGKGKVWKAGIFHVFRPSRVEYIVTGKETAEELERFDDRGFSLVRLTRTGGEI